MTAYEWALCLTLMAAPAGSHAQGKQENTNTTGYPISLTGSVQSDNLIPTGHQDDGSNEDFRSNTYIELNAMSKYVDAGLRFEYL